MGYNGIGKHSMNDWVPGLAGFIVLLAGVAGGVLFYRARLRRRDEMEALAKYYRWTFNRERDDTVSRQFPFFECLNTGENRYAYNSMTGEYEGYPYRGFDYHYQITRHTSKGRRTEHHFFSAVIIGSRIPLKQLYIRPENFLDAALEFVGFDDIDFESAEFSRQFYVLAKDRRWAFDVLHQRTMEFLLSQPRYQIELGPTSVIAWRNMPFSPADFLTAADVICGILKRLPDYVIQQQSQQAGISRGVS
ncbi:MAG: hypothetical protein V2G42_08715 [bacterium JZ-2024 1]